MDKSPLLISGCILFRFPAPFFLHHAGDSPIPGCPLSCLLFIRRYRYIPGGGADGEFCASVTAGIMIAAVFQRNLAADSAAGRVNGTGEPRILRQRGADISGSRLQFHPGKPAGFYSNSTAGSIRRDGSEIFRFRGDSAGSGTDRRVFCFLSGQAEITGGAAEIHAVLYARQFQNHIAGGGNRPDFFRLHLKAICQEGPFRCV